MQHAAEHAAFCDSCGARARYIAVDDFESLACEDCARLRATRMLGEAEVAFDTIGFAVQLARRALVTDDQLRNVLEAILTNPDGEGFYPVGGSEVLRRDFAEDRPWQ